MNTPKTEPVAVTILVLSGATMMTLASIIDPMRAANRLSDNQDFNWIAVSPQGEQVELAGGISFPLSNRFEPGSRGKYLIVIASFDHARHASVPLITKLQAASRNFEILCGVEAGSWLLARAGLLHGKRATTHWEDLENLQQSYPDIDVSDARFTTDGRIWTCGGASPAFDMMLHLIERETTPQRALEVASVFVYDQLHTASDKQPNTSLGLLEQKEPKLAAAIRLMESNIDTPMSIASISARLDISQKTLECLFRRSLTATPGAYYQQLRLQLARKLVIDTRLGIQEIAIRTGFNGQSAFSRAFRKRFGSSPLGLRRQKTCP